MSDQELQELLQHGLLAEFLTEAQISAEIKKTQRTLRSWRQLRIGPPFVRMGREILYRREGFVGWLKSQEQQPVRSRRAA